MAAKQSEPSASNKKCEASPSLPRTRLFFSPQLLSAYRSVGLRAKGYVLQIIEEEFRHAFVEMQARVAAIDKVVAVGVDLHLKLLVGLHQSFRVFRAIAVVYIVVGRTVNEQ